MQSTVWPKRVTVVLCAPLALLGIWSLWQWPAVGLAALVGSGILLGSLFEQW